MVLSWRHRSTSISVPPVQKNSKIKIVLKINKFTHFFEDFLTGLGDLDLCLCRLGISLLEVQVHEYRTNSELVKCASKRNCRTLDSRYIGVTVFVLITGPVKVKRGRRPNRGWTVLERRRWQLQWNAKKVSAMPRKKAFSVKQKKVQLQQKREKKRDKLENGKDSLSHQCVLVLITGPVKNYYFSRNNVRKRLILYGGIIIGVIKEAL